MKNKVTLAICAYNCEDYIEETLDCIVNQTFQDFDLLIVNDCSSDKTKELIQQFLKKHTREYNLVDFKENAGIAFGRKYVLENTLTTYVVFVDSDDKPFPLLVEKLFNRIVVDENLMAVGCYHEYIDRDGVKIGGGLFIGEPTKDGFFEKARNRKLIFMQPTAIINRDIALSVGGISVDGYFDGKPRYQDLCEDLDLWTRMSDLYVDGKAIIVIPEVLSQYRKMDNTASTNANGIILKIKYVKSSLLKRRSGHKEETFVEFFSSITDKQMESIQREAKSAILLREGAFALKDWKVFMAIYKIAHSILLNPRYIVQKIKSNLIK